MKEINQKLVSYKTIYLNLSLQERIKGFEEIVKNWHSTFQLDIYLWNLRECQQSHKFIIRTN
jgi:hypothetical protein